MIKCIEAMYATCTSYDIEDIEDELNIKWNDVEDWWIKWCVLHIEMKDGSKYEYVTDATGDIDWKRPISVKLFDEQFEELDDI